MVQVTGDSKEDLKLKETNVKEKRDADPIPTLTAKDGILTITDINRGLAGNYMVKAKNSEGNAEWSFTIDVECKLEDFFSLLVVCTSRFSSHHFVHCKTTQSGVGCATPVQGV